MGYIINPYTYATGTPFENTYSMAFDGVDDFISYQNSWFAPSTPSQSTGNSVGSFSCWFKTSNWATSPFNLEGILSFTVGSQARPLLWALYRGSATQGNRYLRFYFRGSDGAGGTTGQEQFFVYDNASSTYGGSGISFENDTWYHLALVFDKDATNRVTVYINGSQFLIPNTTTGSGTAGTRTISTSGLPHSLPYCPLSTGIYPSGEIACVRTSSTARTYHSPINLDELSLYDYALTSTNVTSIYNSGTPDDVSSLNPIAFYRMGENGSYKSPQWLLPENSNKDKTSNYVFNFDGVDDYIDCGTASDLNFTGAFTLSVWAKKTGTGSGSLPTIFNSAKNPSNQGGYILCEVANTWKFYVWNGSAWKISQADSTIVNDTWYNIIAIYDGTIIKLYVNGVLQADTETVTSVGYASVNQNAFIGEYVGSHFNGNIDEIALWSSDKTSDIASIYNGGEPTTITGAVSHWKLGEDATFSTNWSIPDNGSGSNTGTSANMTIEDRVGEAPAVSGNALSYNMDEVDREADVP